MRITKQLLLLLFMVLLIGCRKKQEIQIWYVYGENVEIRFSEYLIGFYEDNKLIFEAVTDKESLKKHIFKISRVGNNPIYLSRYTLNKLIKIQYNSSGPQTMKLYLGEPLKRVYTLNRVKNMNYQKNGAQLLNYQTDIDDFLNEVKVHRRNYYPAMDLFFIEPIAESRQWDEQKLKEMLQNAAFKWIMEEPYKDNPEKKPLRNINVMEDFLLDQNPKTAWIAGTEGSRHRIDFLFKTLKSGVRLENNVLVKAIGFYPGFGQSSAEYVKFNRIKKINILFSQEYRGGIGSSQICFDYLNYSVNLIDRQGMQLVYFSQPIPAKSVRIFIEDTYIGYDNIIGLNEVMFYIVDNRNM